MLTHCSNQVACVQCVQSTSVILLYTFPRPLSNAPSILSPTLYQGLVRPTTHPSNTLLKQIQHPKASSSPYRIPIPILNPSISHPVRSSSLIQFPNHPNRTQWPHPRNNTSPEIQLERLEPRPHPPTSRTWPPRHPASHGPSHSHSHVARATTQFVHTITAKPTNTLRTSPTLPQHPYPPTAGAVDFDFPASRSSSYAYTIHKSWTSVSAMCG